MVRFLAYAAYGMKYFLILLILSAPAWSETLRECAADIQETEKVWLERLPAWSVQLDRKLFYLMERADKITQMVPWLEKWSAQKPAYADQMVGNAVEECHRFKDVFTYHIHLHAGFLICLALCLLQLPFLSLLVGRPSQDMP